MTIAQTEYKAVVQSPRGVFIYDSEGKPFRQFLEFIKQLHFFDVRPIIRIHGVHAQTALAVPIVL